MIRKLLLVKLEASGTAATANAITNITKSSAKKIMNSYKLIQTFHNT